MANTKPMINTRTMFAKNCEPCSERSTTPAMMLASQKPINRMTAPRMMLAPNAINIVMMAEIGSKPSKSAAAIAANNIAKKIIA